MAVLPVQPQFSGLRGASGAAGDRGQLRDDPVLDDQVWPPDRQAAEEAARGPFASLAFGRDGLLDGGKRMYLWRAVGDEGEVRDLVVQGRRDTEAAMNLMKRLLRDQPVEPDKITTDGLASYGAALDQLDLRHLHRHP